MTGTISLTPLTFWKLDLAFNAFSGTVSELWATEMLDLSHNHLSGNLDGLADSLCHNGSLRMCGLHLNHNNFEGFVPDCFLQSETLRRLSLNNNHLEGHIPEIAAENLVALTLHHNQFSGTLPNFHSSPRLSVLTLHHNSLEGVLRPMILVSACMDNPSYNINGISCNALRVLLDKDRAGCEDLDGHYGLFAKKAKELLQNCPHTCGVCDVSASSKATFHSNRFSCDVPPRMSAGTLHATAVMGNMLGDGKMLNESWISPEEIQSFLYFSPRVWRANIFILSVISSLLVCMIVFCKPLRRRLLRILKSFSQPCPETRAMCRTVAYNAGVLRVSSLTSLLSCPLLGLFWLGKGYHSCSPPLSQFAATNLRTNSWIDIGVVGLWCVMTIFFRCVIFSMPNTENESATKEDKFAHCKMMCFNIVAWLLWICIAIVLSLPSILFAVAQALPAHNTSGLGANVLSGVHMAAPYLIVLIDVWIAVPLSTMYSLRSGIERSRLVMTLRLFSAWFLLLLTTTFLHENCFGGWKLFWAVCQKNAPERHFFEWTLWDEEILNPTTDMCDLKFFWFPPGRCTRSVVDCLTSLLLKKLLFRSIGMPLLTILSWCLSWPKDGETAELQEGRPLLFMGCWPVTTRMLTPYNQVTLLTTYLEILFFWCPFIPLLSLGLLFVAAANLFLLDIGVWQFGFRAPTDLRNSNATLSKGYLMFALFAGCCFQLCHAFGTKMYGRHMIFLNLAAVALPMPSRLLPIRADWLWSCTIDESRKECQVSIQLTTQLTT